MSSRKGLFKGLFIPGEQHKPFVGKACTFITVSCVRKELVAKPVLRSDLKLKFIL